jgi:hypothetical protein
MIRGKQSDRKATANGHEYTRITAHYSQPVRRSSAVFPRRTNRKPRGGAKEDPLASFRGFNQLVVHQNDLRPNRRHWRWALTIDL